MKKLILAVFALVSLFGSLSASAEAKALVFKPVQKPVQKTVVCTPTITLAVPSGTVYLAPNQGAVIQGYVTCLAPSQYHLYLLVVGADSMELTGGDVPGGSFYKSVTYMTGSPAYAFQPWFMATDLSGHSLGFVGGPTYVVQ